MSTVAASTVAILRYQEINDWSARLFGSGAEWWQIGVLGALAFAGLLSLAWNWRIPEQRRRKKARAAPVPPQQQTYT